MREIEISIIWGKVFLMMRLQWQISFSDGVVTADFREIAKKSARYAGRHCATFAIALRSSVQPLTRLHARDLRHLVVLRVVRVRRRRVSWKATSCHARTRRERSAVRVRVRVS